MRTIKEQIDIIKKMLVDKALAQKISTHVDSCQICATGAFCDRLEKIIVDIEQTMTKDTK